mmetsp:Transcript_101128/g.291119  ORF Transcript_101128/g.291119 Transcript_101128/m.291119 type:complete len:273 (+) Transcript_101128:1219-2037(+)
MKVEPHSGLLAAIQSHSLIVGKAPNSTACSRHSRPAWRSADDTAGVGTLPPRSMLGSPATNPSPTASGAGEASARGVRILYTFQNSCHSPSSSPSGAQHLHAQSTWSGLNMKKLPHEGSAADIASHSATSEITPKFMACFLHSCSSLKISGSYASVALGEGAGAGADNGTGAGAKSCVGACVGISGSPVSHTPSGGASGGSSTCGSPASHNTAGACGVAPSFGSTASHIVDAGSGSAGTGASGSSMPRLPAASSNCVGSAAAAGLDPDRVAP